MLDDVFSSIGQAFAHVGNIIAHLFELVLHSIGNGFSYVGHGLYHLLADFGHAITSVFSSIGHAIASVFGGIGHFFFAIVHGIGHFFSAIGHGIAGSWTSFVFGLGALLRVMSFVLGVMLLFSLAVMTISWIAMLLVSLPAWIRARQYESAHRREWLVRQLEVERRPLLSEVPPLQQRRPRPWPSHPQDYVSQTQLRLAIQQIHEEMERRAFAHVPVQTSEWMQSLVRDPSVNRFVHAFDRISGRVFGDSEKCIICCEDFAESDRQSGTLYCGHLFHVDCIEKWFRQEGSPRCPVCRNLSMPPTACEENEARYGTM